jgi:plastocyanin
MHRLVLLLGLMHVAGGSALAADLAGTAHIGGKPVEDAVVWLEVPQPPVFVQSSKVVLDQRNLSFLPRIMVVRVGTTVDFPNNDKVFHNVFSFRDGKKFDLGMYPTGTSKPILFDRPGLARLFCNIHPNMAAYVMAVDTPYYVVSDDRGAFSIADVPPGTYTYHAWRAGGQVLTGRVTVDGKQGLDIQW